MKKFLCLCLTLMIPLYSKSQESQNIILINVGLSNRGEIAKTISKIYSLNPKVIAIALQFPEAKRKSEKKDELTGGNYIILNDDDQMLAKAFEECSSKLVLPTVMEKEAFLSGEPSISFKGSDPLLMPLRARKGFIYIEEIGKDNVPDLRYFTAYEEIKKNTFGGIVVDTVYQFGIRAAMMFDRTKAINFIHKNQRIIELDKTIRKTFAKYSYEDVLNGRIKPEDIESKMVLIGFMGPGNGDKYFSPWNKKGMEPDMYGLEYQAHIVSQILSTKP